MALENIQLRKLLKIFMLDSKQRRSALLADIRADARREAGLGATGGDFYVPFWADAKSHVFGVSDLRVATARRIAANRRREHLYPLLNDGFLLWWNDRRRWTNTPFKMGQNLRCRFKFPLLDATVKADNLLTVVDGQGVEFVVYSYFSAEPRLSNDAARLGLWLLTQAFPNIVPDQFRILDVIRGTSFSLDRHPFAGDETFEFQARYARVLRERDELRKGRG